MNIRYLLIACLVSATPFVSASSNRKLAKLQTQLRTAQRTHKSAVKTGGNNRAATKAHIKSLKQQTNALVARAAKNNRRIW